MDLPVDRNETPEGMQGTGSWDRLHQPREAKGKRKAFALYPSCFGNLNLGSIVRIARCHGMEVISAGKPNMHVYNEIGVYGTKTQRDAVIKEWAAHGNELKPASFRSVFAVPLNRPREAWVHPPKSHRPYCDGKPVRGNPCCCDYDPSRDPVPTSPSGLTMGAQGGQ